MENTIDVEQKDGQMLEEQVLNEQAIELENEQVADESTKEQNIESQDEQATQKAFKRVKSIDRFRGFLVFAMLVFQFLKEIPSLGFLSKIAQHSLDSGIVILPGMTLADIVAPAFIFAIGLTYVLAFTKYKAIKSRREAYVRYALRSLSIIGVGTILATVNEVLDVLGGGELPIDALVFAVFMGIAVCALIFRCICSIPKIPAKLKVVANWILYSSLALLGLMNMGIAFVDFVALCGDINASTYGYWVTLQNIGMACLIALPLIEAKNWIRFLVAGIIFVGYTIFHQIGDNQALLDVVVHGGFIGGFGWGAMLIFDLFVVELYNKQNKWIYLATVALFAFVGVWSTMWFGSINLGSCSPSFILVGVGLSGLIFTIFHLTDKLPHGKFDPFVWWGKNPLLMFLVEFFVIGSFTSFAPDTMLENAPVWLGIIEGIVAIVLLTTIAWLLSKPKKSISL